jgi:uncharacterized membrane protein
MLIRGYLLWITWNLFLAVVPVALGYTAAALGRRMLGGRERWLWLALAPLLAVWLIFLPNACYLFTEPRHLLTEVENQELWTRSRQEPAAAVRLALWTAIALIYTAAGALTFTLSIRPVKALARNAGVDTAAWAGPFFVLMSLGVYLGLVVRYNSWDLFTRPHLVLDTIAGIASRPVLLAAIVLFGLFLWLTYEVVDIWVDGFTARWDRWTRREERGAREERASFGKRG